MLTNQLRLQKVISEISSFSERTNAELKAGIKKQARELAWFFSLFVCYVMFGAFLFFFIEECSGAAMANDESTPSLYDIVTNPKIKNITLTCWKLYLESQNVFQSFSQANTNSTVNTTSNINNSLITTKFQLFLPTCKNIVESSVSPYTAVEGHQRMCTVNEFQILKYAEYCIFTLLTVGYGNTVPVTIIGRYILIFYAIVGVPIAVTMYSVAGKLLVQIFTVSVRLVEVKLLKREPNFETLRYKVLAVAVFVMIFIMLIGCGVTSRSDMENYDFHTSMYFWFVSMTTIGYGDVLFDRRKHLNSPHFLLLSAGNLLFGLGIVAAIIESFALALEQNELQLDIVVGKDENNNVGKTENHSSKGNLKRMLGKVDFIQNSILIGGMALDLAGERPVHKLSKALLDGGFVFDSDGMYQILVDFKNPKDEQKSQIEIRVSRPSDKDSSPSSGTSYFQVE